MYDNENKQYWTDQQLLHTLTDKNNNSPPIFGGHWIKKSLFKSISNRKGGQIWLV